MPLLRQLEFAFHTVVGQALLLPNSRAATEAVALQCLGRDAELEQIARDLLRGHGAVRIARELHVEWKSRLRTAAGRADYRQKLISLNPQLIKHPAEINRTLRHELAHILAQFRARRRRILPHGVEWRQACHDLGISDEKRCHNLPFPARTYAARFVYCCPHCRQEFPRVRRVHRAVACLACCRKHNGGKFDPRFRLQRIKERERLRLRVSQHRKPEDRATLSSLSLRATLPG
jgi:SprT protein